MSIVQQLLTPMGIARIVLLFLSVIMFSTMADSPNYSVSHTFSYIVATGVFVFIWSIITFCLPFYESYIVQRFNPTTVQLAVDAFLVLMAFFAAVIGAAKCQNDYSVYCKHHGKPNASIAFAFFVLIGQIVCVFLGYRKFSQERNDGGSNNAAAATATPGQQAA